MLLSDFSMSHLLKFFYLLSVIITVSNLKVVTSEPAVPCFFIFGDSLVDNGNNNDLITTSKCNFPPYGVDYPDGPTGRFSNGRNLADFIAEYLGFESHIKPFASVNDTYILQGVNYGSGAAGILDQSGQHMGDRISLRRQFKNHGIIFSRISKLLGNRRLAKEHLNKCIYAINIGSNDYINNYLLPEYYPSSRKYSPEQYAELLVRQYSKQISILYNYGAKKVGIFSIGDLSCTPFELSRYNTDGSTTCIKKIDTVVRIFNMKLKQMVDELNRNFPDANFLFVNQTSDEDTSSLGFTVVSSPCCDILEDNGKGLCSPDGAMCRDRSKYVYWDAFHPTEVANKLLAGLAYLAMSPFYSSIPMINNIGDYQDSNNSVVSF